MSCSCFSRRGLLRGGAAAGAGALAFRFGQRRLFAQANAASGRRFVFVYIPGGWDILLTLDPREFELAVANEDAYRREVQRTQIDTSYKYGPGNVQRYTSAGVYFAPKIYRPAGTQDPFYLGPGVVGTNQDGSPVDGPNLVRLAERGVPMAVIRGINMGTLGHEPGYQYFLTGEPSVGSTGRGTSMPVRVAAGLGETPGGMSEVIVPVVAMGVQSYTGNRSGRYGAFMLSNVNEAEKMLRRPSKLVESSQLEAALTAFARRGTTRFNAESDPSGIMRQLLDSHERTDAVIKSTLADRFGFLQKEDEVSRAVRARYNVNGGTDPLDPGVIAAFAAQAIKNGLAQFVSVGFTKNIVDSHGSSNPGHLAGLYPCFRAVSTLADDLASTPAAAPLKGSWLDNTTIVVFSEFGRTPMHNFINGRDHHFLNACLLMGAGVKAGGVVGASTETGGMQPRFFDFAEQRALADLAQPANAMQRYILPEDVGATLLASAGLDYSEYRNGRPLWGAITHAAY